MVRLPLDVVIVVVDGLVVWQVESVREGSLGMYKTVALLTVSMGRVPVPIVAWQRPIVTG